GHGWPFTSFMLLLCERFLPVFFFFSSRRRHTRYIGDWSSDVCSSDLGEQRTREPAAKLAQNAIGSFAIENRVDRLQRPVLVENDPVAEQALAMEDGAGAVKVVEQEARIAL